MERTTKRTSMSTLSRIFKDVGSRSHPMPTTGTHTSVIERKQVLLVNDTADLRRLKRYILEHAGYAVAEVLDGAAALEYLRQCATPLVVVMNTRIPGVNGAGILRAATAEPSLRRHAFVLTTALARMLPDELEQLTRQLQVPVLGKPFTEQELLAAVASAEESCRLTPTPHTAPC